MIQKWSIWKVMPSPEMCRHIEGPDGPGVYQLRNNKTKELVLFGISNKCKRRMKSLFPAPFGTGKRNNADKRKYVLKNWMNIEYRTCATLRRQNQKTLKMPLKPCKVIFLTPEK